MLWQQNHTTAVCETKSSSAPLRNTHIPTVRICIIHHNSMLSQKAASAIQKDEECSDCAGNVIVVNLNLGLTDKKVSFLHYRSKRALTVLSLGRNLLVYNYRELLIYQQFILREGNK